jgi:folate-binding protein YgfZ
MTQTALTQRLAFLGNNAFPGPYNGVETVLAFSDAASELRTLLSSCGVFDLGWRTKISVTGKDRVRWLNGMITNNIRDLAVDHGNYNFALSHQGRILADMYAYNLGDSLLLDTDRSQSETILKTIGRYIIMDDVKLADSGDTLSAIGVCGPKAEQVLATAGLDVADLEPLQLRRQVLSNADVTIVRGPEQKPSWYEIWPHPDNAQTIWSALTSSGAAPVGARALEFWRILRGIPQYGPDKDIRERDLPQETEQHQALCFTKGCYIGQEIVERIRSRGQVHRKFTGLEFPDGLTATGKYDVEGRTLAEITTTVRVPLPAGDKNIGLAYVRRDAAPAGSQIELNGQKVKVTDLPFHISSH